ncbi:hypothetical protein AMECASPLE_015576 [Ameca splendens]|uniref:Uncharacterized protein n=1 Tax=Ameca splendens TaxID=208324 RepID=A0ABV0Y1T9_9TELE
MAGALVNPKGFTRGFYIPDHPSSLYSPQSENKTDLSRLLKPESSSGLDASDHGLYRTWSAAASCMRWETLTNSDVILPRVRLSPPPALSQGDILGQSWFS